MHDAQIAELEAAARIVMLPASSITREQRQLAESVIMKFRSTPAPYALCREILEKSGCDLLRFEAADTLKRSIIGEWHTLQPDDRLMLREYLLQYCIERDMPTFIRAKVLQVVAIMIKRVSIADTGMERMQIMNQMGQMIALGTQHQQYLGCRIVNTLMQEFLTTIKSDDTGLTFEEHFKAKKMFELSDLKRIYVIVFQAAEKLMAHLNSAEATGAGAALAEPLTLLAEYLAIFELIMQWGYTSPLLPRRLISVMESNSKIEQTPALRLGSQWGTVILESNVLDVFFGIYWKVRELANGPATPVAAAAQQMQHRALTCLVQLATLNGPVLDTPEKRTKYVTEYMQHFLQMFGGGGAPPVAEAYSVAMVFRKVLLQTHENCWVSVPEEIRNTILQQMFTVACTYMELAVREEQDGTDELRWRPALDMILEAWLLVLQMRRSFLLETIQQYSVQMFNKYLQTRLTWAAINGAGVAQDPNVNGHPRRISCAEHTDDPDAEQTDQERYAEQLAIMGMLARENLPCTLPTLCGLLEERTATLREQLLRIYTAQTVQPTDQQVLEPIYDDIQWLTMIAAHVLATQKSGSEEPEIPFQVRQFGMERERNGQVCLRATLQLLAAPAQQVTEVENAEQGADLVVRCVAAVFRLCDLESKAIELKMQALLSPVVTQSLMWFVLLWGDAYLLDQYFDKDSPKEAPTSDTFCEALKQAFACSSEGGRWTIDFLLNKICVNVRSFPGEPKVVETSLDVFAQCAMKLHKARVIFSSEYFRQIMALRHLDVPKELLLRGLMLMSVCVEPDELRSQYLFEVLSPLQDAFQRLEWQQAMSSASEHGKSIVSHKLIRLLDEIRSCCAGTKRPSAKTAYSILEPVLRNLADVVDLFHNYQAVVVAVLELLCVTVDRLRSTETRLNEICDGVVLAYVRHNASRFSLKAATAAGGPQATGTDDEDSLQDLELLLRLARTFLNACMFDLVQDKENDGEEVCMSILQHILPMISLDMLRYPEFCMNFYKTLELFVDKSMGRIQSPFMQSIMQSLSMGLQAFGSEVQSVSLSLLRAIASNTYFDQNPEAYIYSALQPCLRQLFVMILQHEIDTDNRNECCAALFTMLCVYRAHYAAVVESVLAAYADRSKVDLLKEQIERLVDKDALYNNRAAHLTFGKRFEKFMANLTRLC